jgi:hypothetical protein
MASDVKVADWLLERMAAGELPPAQAEALLARLRAEGDEDRLSKLAESNAEILRALPPSQVAREVERRSAARAPATRPRLRRPLWAWSMATACAASIAILVAVSHKGPTEEYIGLKGDGQRPALRIYRKTKAGVELLGPNAEVSKGDTLQIRYVAAGKRFGVIASVDGRGTLTFHLPETAGPATALSRDGERALAHAYELDDSPKFERFFFVTSDAPFATDQVASSLRSGTALPPPLVSYEISLRKSP